MIGSPLANGGVPPTDVAEWAGQSVEVLIYAKCLDRGTERNRKRVQEALGHEPGPPNGGAPVA